MRIGIITGSGTEALLGLVDSRTRSLRTRFGEIEVSEGRFATIDAVHISRHGTGHARLSSHVQHRANIAAFAEVKVDAVIAVTICGALDPSLPLGSLIVFDDLYFPSNRLPDGSLCTIHQDAGVPGRGHWIFEQPFSGELRQALLAGAQRSGRHVRDGGCYGHVDGPRFGSRTEIRALAGAGVSAVSQTAGPEAVLAGESKLPYALLGYVTDYANGVSGTATPIGELMRLVEQSTAILSEVLAVACERSAAGGHAPRPAGSVVDFD